MPDAQTASPPAPPVTPKADAPKDAVKVPATDAKPDVKADAKADMKPADAVKADAPAKADPPLQVAADSADKPVEVLKWFECRASFAVGAMNVLAKDAEAAEKRFKKALGVRSFHPGMDHKISVAELPGAFVPSEKDKEQHDLIDQNHAPVK